MEIDNYINQYYSIPQNSEISKWIEHCATRYNFKIVIVKPRKTKLGTCKFPITPAAEIKITLNKDMPVELFLNTMLHEIAHAIDFRTSYIGFQERKRKPHDAHWKRIYRMLISEFVQLKDLSKNIKEYLTEYLDNISATYRLSNVSTDKGNKLDENSVWNLKNGAQFLFKKRSFKKIKNLRSFSLCVDLKNNKRYRVRGSLPIKTD